MWAVGLILQDDTNEIDLGDFACRTVNVSFALATEDYGVSEFSPPLSLEVQNRPGESKASSH